jgi:hypothetical protein
VRVEDWWNWLRITFSGKLWYSWYWTFSSATAELTNRMDLHGDTLWWQDVGGTDSGICPMASFGITGLEPSSSATRACGCYLVHLQSGKLHQGGRPNNAQTSFAARKRSNQRHCESHASVEEPRSSVQWFGCCLFLQQWVLAILFSFSVKVVWGWPSQSGTRNGPEFKSPYQASCRHNTTIATGSVLCDGGSWKFVKWWQDTW